VETTASRAFRLADDHVVHPQGHGLVHPHAGGGVGLGVEIAQEDPLPGLPQRGAEVDARGGLAHAALLIDNRNGFRQHGTCFPVFLSTFNIIAPGRTGFKEKAKKSAARQKMFHVKQQNGQENRRRACFT
jgi:hypothetical protein